MTSLADLLPSSSYDFAYAFPLLASSIVLTFAGTFLTLDRTRSFAPSYDAIPGDYPLRANHNPRFRWNLQGGVGGIAVGYAFGVHTSTFLALLIPNTSSSAALGFKSFLAVWILSSIPAIFLAARWKIAALLLSGFTGGALFALALSVIIHPALLTRIVLVAVFAVLLTIATLLPIPNTQHTFLRISTSATGAFGIILSAATLAHISPWENVWERLWVSNGNDWGTSQEHGLSAGFCLLFALGMLLDWALKRRFGECPDQKWDEYLSKYSTNMPDREGTFQPFRSLWDRAFGRPDVAAFPVDEDSKDSPPPPLYKLHNHSRTSPRFEYAPEPAFLKKAKSHSHTKLQTRTGRRKDVIKFDRAWLSSDSEDEASSVAAKPSMSSSSSTGTLVGASDQIKPDPAPEYSDHEEEDISTIDVPHKSAGESPRFLKQNRSSTSSAAVSQRAIATTPPPLMPVPATPSLIKALDRVSAAQKAAYSRPGLPPEEDKGHRWDQFWKDVQGKAEHR